MVPVSYPESGGLAMVAWLVAGTLAVAVAGIAFAIACYRRSREAELRLRQLESALAEFCTALRGRLALERTRWCEEQGAEESRMSATEEGSK